MNRHSSVTDSVQGADGEKTASALTVLAVVSPKGGVGKTSVAANLAVALSQQGRAVVLVDLDPQNSARLHFQWAPPDSWEGVVPQDLMRAPWADAMSPLQFGVRTLPYGVVAEEDRRHFERGLEADAGWLRSGLEAMGFAAGTLVIIDTPPGASVYMRQALTAADVSLVVMLPDAGSFATLPSMERWIEDYASPRPEFQGAYYLVNRMNRARVLCRDVLAAASELLGDRLVPQQLHFDAAMEEALASQLPVACYAANSQAAQDIDQIAAWLLERL